MSIAARETDVRICDLLCHGANAPVAANVPQKGPFPIQRGPPGLREGQKGAVPAAEGLAFIQCWSIGARTIPQRNANNEKTNSKMQFHGLFLTRVANSKCTERYLGEDEFYWHIHSRRY